MNLSEIIRSDTPLSGFGRFALAVRLAVPAILAQISAVVMGYIDASMVGSLGADAAASIGLVATSTWLFNGLCSAGAVGFYVQTAHQLGAGRPEAARAILRQAMTSCLLYSLLLMAIGAGISGCLPHWLGRPVDSARSVGLFPYLLAGRSGAAIYLSAVGHAEVCGQDDGGWWNRHCRVCARCAV